MMQVHYKGVIIMMKIRKCGIFGDERGVELVELAVVLPLLAILLMGGFEFGRAFYTYNILTKSVRDAARYLSADSITSAGVISATTIDNTKKIAVFGCIPGVSPAPCSTSSPSVVKGLSEANFNVPAGTVVSSGKIYVTVSANYSYQSVFRFVLPGATFRPSETMIFVGHIIY
jgi:Flp pilus assembly protein TadG